MKITEKFDQKVATLGTIITSATAIIGIIPSFSKEKSFLGISQIAGLVILLACSILFVLFYIILNKYNKQTILLKNAQLSINGVRLNTVSQALVHQTVNTSFKKNFSGITYNVNGTDLEWTYEAKGIRISKGGNFQNGYIHTIGSDKFVPFKDIECYAYDLINDPEKKHKLQPSLLGEDGISKKVFIPFHKPILYQGPFHIILKVKQPGTIVLGKDYVTYRLSFADNQITDSTSVTIIFGKPFPKWVNLHKVVKGEVTFENALFPKVTTETEMIYQDLENNVAGAPVKIYFFER